MLDTSVLIACASQSEATPDLSGLGDLFVSSLSWSELSLGPHIDGSIATYRERSRRLELLHGAFGDGIPYDDACDEMLDEVLARVAQRNGSLRAHRVDRMLAATAMAHEIALVTRNAADFAMFDGMLEVVER